MWMDTEYNIQDDISENTYNQLTPCDFPDDDGKYYCPYDAQNGDGCRRFCGVGVDE